MIRRILVPAAVGISGAALVTAGLVFGLEFSPLIAGGLGIVVGGGGALISLPRTGSDDQERVAEMLEAITESVTVQAAAVRGLRNESLWQASSARASLARLSLGSG